MNSHPSPWNVADPLLSDIHLKHGDNRVSGAGTPRKSESEIRAALPSGGYLALSHGTSDIKHDGSKAVADAYSQRASSALFLRDREQVTAFFEGFELVDPGVVHAVHWRPPPGTEPRPVEQAPVYAGLGRRP